MYFDQMGAFSILSHFQLYALMCVLGLADRLGPFVSRSPMALNGTKWITRTLLVRSDWVHFLTSGTEKLYFLNHNDSSCLDDLCIA
jgi:hypothetical protein